jgi:hypothetical protein
MTELFPIQVTAPNLPPAGDRPVIFHGVNKSGSLAMADVMYAAHEEAGRIDEVVSNYHNHPPGFDDLDRTLQTSRGSGLFVAHCIYGRLDIPPDALLVSQIRHPLPRTLSVYGWMKRGHLRRHKSLDGFPPFDAWLRSTGGKHHSQIAQFAIGFGEGWRARTKLMALPEMHERALEHLYRDFTWFGVAEFFEESIYVMAHLCGLRAVPAWTKDTRNQARQRLDETSPEVIDAIHNTFAYDFAFYNEALATFNARIANIDFGSSLMAYKERCKDAYGERLVTS